MSAEEEKVAPVAVAAEEPVQVEQEKPKSEKKKTPKSPKGPKKSAEKKVEADVAPEAAATAEEKHTEKNGVEEEKAAVPAEEKPAEAPVVADEKVETTDTPKKEKKDKKKVKEDASAAPGVDAEKKEKEKEKEQAAPTVSSRGRSNSKAALKSAQQLEEEADNTETIRLWHQTGNVRSSRVLWLLKELEGTVAEHLKVTNQTSHKDKRETIAAVNPTGEVPTLRFGNPGFSLFEPGAMFQYLLETHPGPLLPTTLTPEERARHAQYEHWLLGQVDTRVADTGVAEKLTRTNTNWFRTTVEAFISADLGLNEYMNGEKFSATDIIIGSSLWAADQHGLLSHVATSAIHAYYERLRNRPHFIDVFGAPPEPKEPRSPRTKVEGEEKKKEEKKEKKEKKKDDKKENQPEEVVAAAPASPRGKEKKEKKEKKSKDEKKDEEKKDEEKKVEGETPAAVLAEALAADGPAPVEVALTRPDAEPTPTAVQGPVTETQAVVAEEAAPAPVAASAAPVAADNASETKPAETVAAPAPAAAAAPAAEKAASSESDSPISSSSSE